MLLAGAGVLLGMGAAFFLSGTLSSLLFDIRPTDPLTFAAVAGTLGAVALLASYIPRGVRRGSIPSWLSGLSDARQPPAAA